HSETCSRRPTAFVSSVRDSRWSSDSRRSRGGGRRFRCRRFAFGRGCAGRASGRPCCKWANWQVETQPSPNDPMLEGTITATNRRFKKQDGEHEIDALQLYVKQTLGDYRGYSGSPVVLPSPSGAVIGILDEQFL